ncbi:MAG: hypothetical protein ACRD4E_18600 [Bryobacteraceae bacterium]
MRQVKSIGVLQTATVMGALYFVFGVIFGVLAALVSIFTGHFGHAIFLLIVPPIGYAIAGFVLTAIMSAVYNVVAKKIGGIEVDVS